VRDVPLRHLQHEGDHAVQGVCGAGITTADPERPLVKSLFQSDGPDFTSLGIVVGHASDPTGVTGSTVIRRATGPMRCGGVQLGRATASREFGLADPQHSTDRVDAILLTGGSAYGLDAASGVMRWMEEQRRGFSIAGGVVPIVPAAAIFDLGMMGPFTTRPTPEVAYQACVAGVVRPSEGSVGAGTRASVGKVAGAARAMKGGFGAWVVRSGEIIVGAVVVTNAVGDIRDGNGRIIAGARGDGGRFLDATTVLTSGGPRRGDDPPAGMNTTIGAVMTNALLSRADLQQLARAATAAWFKRITPCATQFDGDTLFALGPQEGITASLIAVEVLAVQAMEMAVERSVRFAKGRDGVPGLADPAPPREK
jgi:L-aminopeptidase/D-esterase-like protein